MVLGFPEGGYVTVAGVVGGVLGGGDEGGEMKDEGKETRREGGGLGEDGRM